MYCDRCGHKIESGHAYCGACGKPAGTRAAESDDARIARHLRLLGVFWLVLSGLRLLGAGAMLIVGLFVLPNVGLGGREERFIPAFVMLVGAFVFLCAVAGFAAGMGLLRRQSWARILALVLAFLALLDPPFGTALGIYTIWILIPSRAESTYQRMAQSPPAG
jgi:hypothetical protein